MIQRRAPRSTSAAAGRLARGEDWATPIAPGRDRAGTRRRLAMLALVAAASLWGTSFLFGKVALRELGPADLTLLRFALTTLALTTLALTTLALLPVALIRRVYPRWRDLPLFALTGVLTVPATFLIQFAGLQRTSASITALIVGSNAPLIAVAARLFLGERLGRAGWIAVGLSSLGVALTVSQPGAGNDWTGDALVFLSMLAVVGWVLLGRRLTRDYAPVAATAYIIGFGTLVTLPLALLLEGPPRVALSAGAWVSVAMLGLGCSAGALALWNWGQRGVPAGRASIYLNLEPLVGALLAVWAQNPVQTEQVSRNERRAKLRLSNEGVDQV